MVFKNSLATLSLIATMICSAATAWAVPLNFSITFDDFLIPGTVNWTGSYTVESTTGLLTRFEATICRTADPLQECIFNNLFNLSLPANDDPDDNDNVITNVLTPTNSAVLGLFDGPTNEWQIFDPFGSQSHGVYMTRQIPESDSLLLTLVGILMLASTRWQGLRMLFSGSARPINVAD